MLQVIIAILGFGLLVVVHEWGHFITAKRGGIQVNEFWIGMGPTLLKKEHNGTVYCLKLLPLGGACVMEGEDSESESEGAFARASLPRRILVVAAGALMNFALGFLLVLATTQPNGPNGGYIEKTLAAVDPQSAAAGKLQAGDEILKIDGFTLLIRSDLSLALSLHPAETHEITVRRDGKTVTLSEVSLEAKVDNGNGGKQIGLTFAEQPRTIGSTLSLALRTSGFYGRLVWVGLVQLVTGQVGVSEMSGPVGVAGMMAQTVKTSVIEFFRLLAFISINLGVMNLLPLPALDGGRLVFLLIEAVRRKPVPPKYEGYIHAAGLALLLLLMVYVTGQDIWRLVRGIMP